VRYVADYFHDRGLKLGIYSSAGRSVNNRNLSDLILLRHFCVRRLLSLPGSQAGAAEVSKSTFCDLI
jgi:hypothetical protein